MAKTSAEIMQMLVDNNVKFVDLRFTDFKGKEQHVSVPVSAFDEDKFEEGHAFDGSSIAGWKGIEASDMLLMPDPDSARMDPFADEDIPTMILTCNVVEPSTGKGYDRDPRSVANRAEAYLKSTGIGDNAYFGPEPEFFIFNGVSWGTTMNHSFFKIESEEGYWSNGKDMNGANSGHRPTVKGGYFPVPPVDSLYNVRSQMCELLEEQGVPVEVHHHEVGGCGQCEIGTLFSTLTKRADWTQILKYTVWNVAAAYGMTATFMPKPVVGDNGSGMHSHMSLWKDGSPLFYDEAGYGGLSDTARHYIGGILHHAPSLLAFTNPTINSYHRLVPGFEAPVNLVYSQRNRSACMRIPITGSNPKAKRVEFRCPDPSGNPYLAFAAMLMAGLDGIKNKIEPAEPIDKDLYELPPEEARNVPQVPDSLAKVIDNLETDHEFLLEGGVFTPDLIETWIRLKREDEIDPIRLRPHPHEYALYFDV